MCPLIETEFKYRSPKGTRIISPSRKVGLDFKSPIRKKFKKLIFSFSPFPRSMEISNSFARG